MTPTTRLFVAGLAALCVGAPVYGQNAPEPSLDSATLQKAAYNVDKFVAELYRQKKLSVPKVVDDATFLRRSFLVAAGRIPTLDEARMFLEIDDENKRAMLADYLMKSDGYRSHMTNWALDLLRVQDEFEHDE